MRIAGMRLQNLADNCRDLQIADDAQMWETRVVSRFASKIHIWTGQQVRGSPICKLQITECKSNAGRTTTPVHFVKSRLEFSISLV